MSQSQEEIQVEAIRGLTKEIPTNDFGMPTGIYRTDLLPFHDYKPNSIPAPITNPAPTNGTSTPIPVPVNGTALPLLLDTIDDDEELTQELEPVSTEVVEYRIGGFLAESLHQAFVPLQFDEGFPAFENGIPFWSRFEFEPLEAFKVFQKYTQMNRGSPSSDPDDDYDGESAEGARSIADLATSEHPQGDIIDMVALYQRYYHLYYWGLRAHAYDLFRVAQFQKKQELRAVETMDEHYIVSRRIRHRLMQYMDDEGEFWDLMTPKIAIDMFKALTGLERISAGMPSAGPVSEKTEDRSATPFELVLKTVAQTGRSSEGDTYNEDGELLDKALGNPEYTKLLQELIIRGST